MLESSGLPVGLVEDTEYVPHEIVLSPGDRVFFFSDGLYEDRRLDGEDYGLERLKHFFGEMRHFPIKEAVRRSALEIERWTHPGALQDDVSLIVLEAFPPHEF